MRKLPRSCLSHSSVAISEMCGRYVAIHNQTTSVGAQGMAGVFLTAAKRLGRTFESSLRNLFAGD